MNEVSALIDETPDSSFPPHHVRTQREDGIYETGVSSHQTPNQDSTSILDFAASRSMRYKFFLLKKHAVDGIL